MTTSPNSTFTTCPSVPAIMMDMQKRCSRCEEEKPPDQFWKRSASRDGLHYMCIPCAKEYSKTVKRRNNAQRTAYNREWRRRNPDKVRAWRATRSQYNKTWYEKRLQVLGEMYGNKCVCCGETERMFLTIDHIDGVPSDHLTSSGKRIGGNQLMNRLFQYFETHGVRDPRCQMLCFNCNLGSERNDGMCPHVFGG